LLVQNFSATKSAIHRGLDCLIVSLSVFIHGFLLENLKGAQWRLLPVVSVILLLHIFTPSKREFNIPL
jgi:hypothetical protein